MHNSKSNYICKMLYMISMLSFVMNTKSVSSVHAYIFVNA